MSPSMPRSLTFRRPDDWHVHFRDGPMLEAVVPWTARQFARAIVMPNLNPPVTTVAAAQAYRKRIMASVPKGVAFEPLMTAYLTNDSDPLELERGFAEGVWVAAKLYPAKATTNSHFGVTDINRLDPVFAAMAKIGMKLLIHGEVADLSVDIFDREAVFINDVLVPLAARHPDLKIVFEHITTEDAVKLVQARPMNMAATITPHHLVLTRSDIFEHGIRPHLYCLPIAKRSRHRDALRAAAVSGDARFFLGTDSAPHPERDKLAACGCAGVFAAPTALAVYLQVFAEEGALDQFERFASLNGPAFYGLPFNDETVTWVSGEAWRAPDSLPGRDAEPGSSLTPFRAGQLLTWSEAK
jgi:dihydroorotase